MLRLYSLGYWHSNKSAHSHKYDVDGFCSFVNKNLHSVFLINFLFLLIVFEYASIKPFFRVNYWIAFNKSVSNFDFHILFSQFLYQTINIIPFMQTYKSAWLNIWNIFTLHTFTYQYFKENFYQSDKILSKKSYRIVQIYIIL